MKLFIVFAICIAGAIAAPNRVVHDVPAYASLGPEEEFRRPHVPIESMSHEADQQGGYNLHFKSADGQHQTQGSMKDLGDAEGPVIVKKGSYSYPGTDGKQYTVNWTSDENGFHATGDHLPTSPPIPDEINRSIDRSSLPADHHLVQAEGAFPKRSHDLFASSLSGYGR